MTHPDPAAPRTAAGRVLLDLLNSGIPIGYYLELSDRIRAIEAEAANPPAATAAEGLDVELAALIRMAVALLPDGKVKDELSARLAAGAKATGSADPIHNHGGGEHCFESRCPAYRPSEPTSVSDPLREALERLAQMAEEVTMYQHGTPYAVLQDIAEYARAALAATATGKPAGEPEGGLDEWQWTGDWPPPARHGAGDGWMHVHPDGTRWVHPEKVCGLATTPSPDGQEAE